MKELILGIWTQERKAWVKRKLAAWLCSVRGIQSALPAQPAFGAQIPEPDDKNVIELQGDPDEAFDYIRAKVGDKIGAGGDSLSLYFYFGLNDEYRDDKLAEYIENGTLIDLYDFEYNDAYKDLYTEFGGNYDNYLLSRHGLENPEFTCTVNEGLLDVAKIREYLESSSEIITTRGDRIGTWEIENTADGPQFRIVLNNLIYNRSNIIANKGIQISLRESYEPGTDVDAQPGGGNVDIEITVNGEGTPTATDSNYEMEKFADISEEDPSEIIYTVMAYASSSDADAALATSSNISIATGADISAYIYDEDDEDEEGLEPDAIDMELINDLEIPVQSHIVRRRAAAADGVVVASDSNLIGKYISDTISDGLLLDMVEISYDGYSWEELSPDELGGYDSWEAYLEDNGRTFFYQIEGPDGETGTEDAAVQIFGVRFRTRLNEAGWREYAAKGELHKVFPNRAVLKDEDEVTTLTASNKVEPRLDWSSILEKEGLPLDVSGKVYEWHIDTGTKFSDGVQLYAVDCLKDIENTHKYIWDDPDYPVTITRNGQTDTLEVSFLTEEELWAAGAVNYDFEHITIDDIQTILGGKYLDGNAYIYEYDYQEGPEDGVKETKRAAVMLIPLDDHANGESRITYYTDITKANENGLNYSTSIENAVTAVWKWNVFVCEWLGTVDFCSVAFGSVIIKKEYEIDVKPVAKEGVSYDELTNLITWEFEVNRPGVALDELWIEDALDVNESSWAGAVKDGRDLVLTGYNRSPSPSPAKQAAATEPNGRDLTVPYMPEAAEDPDAYAEANYYTVTEKDGKQVLTVHLYGVKAEDYYKFQVKTYVENRNYVVSALVIENKAEYWGTSGDQTIEKHEVTAKQPITHTLIAKSVEPFADGSTGSRYLYDYENNTVQWKVRINEKGLPIANAVITDELPLGVSFPCDWADAVTGAVRVSGAASWNGTWTPGTEDRAAGAITFDDGMMISVQVTEGFAAAENGREYSSDTVTFTFKDASGEPAVINHRYEITFITQLDEEFCREVVKSSEVTSLLNRAKLDGTIDGREVQTGWVTAENAAVPKPLVKEGRYHGKTGNGRYEKYIYQYYDENDVLQSQEVEAAYFNWTAYVNRTGADMLGAKISDQVADCFELADASINIYEIKLDAVGNPIPGLERMIVENRRPYEDAAALTDLTADEAGFSFSIPEEYRNSTLKITFDTILVDDAVASEMTNRITAEGAGWKDSSEDATDSRADDFRIEDYAQAEGMFFLRVVKSSGTTDALALKGAQFKLTRMHIDSGKDRTDLGNWTETSAVKTRTTNARGVLNFMFLRTNEMYKLEEVVPPVGYDRTEKVWYVIIRPEEGALFPSEDTVTVEGRPVEILIEKNRNYVNTGIKNLPNGVQNVSNNLKLKKLGQNSQTLAGVEFGLYLDNRRVKAGTTDADGILELADLDPLKEGRYYLLKETTPEGYETAAPIRVYVTVKKNVIGNDTYTIRLTRTDGEGHEEELVQEGEDYLITNEAVRRSGSFSKVDQNGDLVTGFDVVFDVSRRGDGGSNSTGGGSHTVVMAPEGDGADRYVTYNVAPTVTSENGIVRLRDFYYGYYKLTEQENEDKLLSAAAPLYVRVNEKGVSALPMGTYTDEEVVSLEDSAYTVDLGNAAALKLENDLKWGLVQVNKAVGKYDDKGNQAAESGKDGSPIPVKGVVFAIYRGKDGSRETAPMMYVKTGEDGRFIMLDAEAGKYRCFDQNGNALKENGKDTGRVLPVGSYSLKEVKVTDDSYYLNTGICGFDIAAGSGSGTEYAPADPVVIATNEGGEPEVSEKPDGLFLNLPVRRGVNLRKVDADYTNKLNLNNAQFHIYDGKGRVIAELICDEAAKTPGQVSEADRKYVLKPMGTIENCRICEGGEPAVNGDGVPYLAQNEDGSTYELLPGTYTVKETKAPVLIGKDGNEYPDVYPELTGNQATAKLVVTAADVKLQSANGSVIYRGVNGFKNQAKRAAFKIDKKVLKLTGTQHGNEGEYSYGQSPKDFTFVLTAMELMHGAVAVEEKDKYTRKTGDDGVAAFGNIPIGKYRLEETDVPLAYKSGEEWLVQQMDPIYVEVKAEAGKDAAVVSYYSDKDFTKPLKLQPSNEADISTDTSDIYDKGSSNYKEKDSVAYNSLKLANIEGSKEAVFGTSRAPLSGAEFTLTHQSLGYTFKYTTGGDGAIRFNKVPYGAYKLEETKVPDGYQKMADMTFTIGASAVDADGVYQINRNKPETERAIENKVITVNACFKKVNQNGDVVSSDYMGTQFKVAMTETTIAGLADGPFEDEDHPGQYTKEKVFPVDADGILTITGLPYGTYDVQELASSVEGKLDDPADLAHFILTVEKGHDVSGGTSGTKVTVKNYVEGNAVSRFLKNAFNSNSDGWHIDGLKHGETADFSSPDANPPLMTNILNYGFVKIKKVRGEQTGEGTFAAGGSPVKGAVFEIYQTDQAGGRGDLYLTLKTDEKGGFPAPDQDGKYQDAAKPEVKKALVAGNYILKEKEIEGSSAYKLQETANGASEIAFAITGKDQTVWFGTDGNYGLTQTTANTGNDMDITFMNLPKRGTLHFTKVDADTEASLAGAVFGVYDGDDLVAFAEYSESKGDYRIVTGERASELAASNKDWSLTAGKQDASGEIPYTSDRDGAGWLLEGEYTLKELQAPSGDYILLDESIRAAITDGGDTAVNSSGAAEGIIKNGIQKTAAELTFKKQVEENAYRPGMSGNGFEFVLRGTPSNSHDMWTEQKFTSGQDENKDGIFRIADIPVGTYALYEQKPSEDAYQGFEGKTEVKLFDMIVTAEASGEPKVEITAAETVSRTEPDGVYVEVTYDESGASTIIGAGITNNWKTGTITGQKVARAQGADGTAEVPLEGIYFALYETKESVQPIAGTGGAEAAKYLAVTDADGSFRFENVPYGTYWVGEYGTIDGRIPEGYAENGLRQQVKVSKNGEAVKVAEVFVNERLRGTAVVDKVSAADRDADGNPVKLSGAEFTVYANEGSAAAPVPGGKVAFLTESPMEPGHYVLNNVNGAGEVLNETVPSGRIGAGLPYLEYDSGTQTFWLAYGEYVVAETRTPAGYRPDVQKRSGRSLITGTPAVSLLTMHPLTISGTQGQLWYVGNDGASTEQQTFANSRSLADLKIAKQVEVPTYSGEEKKFETGSGFRFAVSGTVDDPGIVGGETGLDLTAYLERIGRTDLNDRIETDPVTGAVRVVITSDDSGTAVLTDLPSGVYMVEELVEDSDIYSYRPDHDDNAKRQVKIGFGYNTETGSFDPTYEWTWTQDGSTAVNGSASEALFKNHLKRGFIQGRKVAADNETVGLEGAVFGLYTDENCTDVSRVMTAASSNASNPSGGFTFEQVPYGTYYIKEIKAPSGYVPSTMQYRVSVTAQGAHVTQGSAGGEDSLRDIVFTNSNKRGDVRLTKKSDDGTGVTELMPGMAEFTIYADEECTQAEAVAYLKDGDRDGVYTLESGDGLKRTVNGVRYLQRDGDGALKLIQGTYWLKETKIPDGYEAEMDGTGPKTYQFTIHSDDDETVEDLGTAVISNNGDDTDPAFLNRLALGGFELEKTIETSRPDDIAAADDKTPGAGFVFEITGKDAVEGSLRNLADIKTLKINNEAVDPADVTADGGIRVTTDDDGRVQISGLPVGSYTVTEVDGPDYDLYTGTTPRMVELTQSSDKAQLLTAYDGVGADPAADSLRFHNSLKRYTIAGQKVDDGGIALAGAEFGLYSEDGSVQYRTAVSAENGRFVFDKVPVGEYVVKELKAPSAAYTKDDEEYRISVRADMDTDAEIQVSGRPVVNTLKRGNIEGMKLTNRQAPLAGAVIGLFAEGTAEFVEANLFEGRTAVSEADGSFAFRDVPYGTYRIAEVKAPAGYGLNKVTTFTVRITQAGETVRTGYLTVPNREPADTETEIVIVNSRNSGGGSGGGGSTQTGPSVPGGPGSGLPVPNPNNEMMVTINDNEVPLGQFMIPIEDEEVPLALPKTGRNGIPAALQAAALLGSLVGALFLRRRKKDKETP